MNDMNTIMFGEHDHIDYDPPSETVYVVFRYVSASDRHEARWDVIRAEVDPKKLVIVSFWCATLSINYNVGCHVTQATAGITPISGFVAAWERFRRFVYANGIAFEPSAL